MSKSEKFGLTEEQIEKFLNKPQNPVLEIDKLDDEAFLFPALDIFNTEEDFNSQLYEEWKKDELDNFNEIWRNEQTEIYENIEMQLYDLKLQIYEKFKEKGIKKEDLISGTSVSKPEN